MNRQFILGLYNNYHNELEKFIISSLLSHSPQDTADCLQNVYLTAMNADDLESHENIRGWLFLTSRNFVNRLNTSYLFDVSYRNEISEKTKVSEGFEDSIIEDFEYIRMTSEKLYEKITNSLTCNEQLLYNLKYKLNYSTQELCESLGITESSVYVRNKRLKDKIKKILNSM